MLEHMKLVANIRLIPDKAQETLLRATLERCNEACNWLSEQAWGTRTLRQYDMQKAFYRQLREQFGLTAQAAIRTIKKVADAYKASQLSIRTFRKHSAQPYDDRIFRFVADERISIRLLNGREVLAYVCGEHQRRLLEHRKGEVDLMLVRGKWYIACVCDFEDPGSLTLEGMLGVDFGIVSLIE